MVVQKKEAHCLKTRKILPSFEKLSNSFASLPGELDVF